VPRATSQRAVPPSGTPPRWTKAAAACCRLDREQVLLPLVDAASRQARRGTLETAANGSSKLTRRLRDALHRGLAHLQFGQVLLASIGSTAPFVGLFGTVWGIYHALLGITSGGQREHRQGVGPIGEALIMTAAGIAVAVPAVLAFNVFGKWWRPARPTSKALRTTCARWRWTPALS
jgi:biopolymer transport protein ExbB